MQFVDCHYSLFYAFKGFDINIDIDIDFQWAPNLPCQCWLLCYFKTNTQVTIGLPKWPVAMRQLFNPLLSHYCTEKVNDIQITLVELTSTSQ